MDCDEASIEIAMHMQIHSNTFNISYFKYLIDTNAFDNTCYGNFNMEIDINKIFRESQLGNEIRVWNIEYMISHQIGICISATDHLTGLSTQQLCYREQGN